MCMFVYNTVHNYIDPPSLPPPPLCPPPPPPLPPPPPPPSPLHLTIYSV